MSIIDKIKGAINPNEANGDYADYYGPESEETGDAYSQQGNYQQQYQPQYQPAQPQPAYTPTPSVTVSDINRSAGLELKVVRPDRFGNVTQIADHLLNHRTVVLNLEATNKETSRRIIDFLTGVAYSINGQLKKVAASTYVITPSNIDVSNDQTASSETQEDANSAAQSDPTDYYAGL